MFGGPYGSIDAHAFDAGHGCDRLGTIVTIDDEDGPNQVRGG
jgi:hypothetical protein